MQIHGRTKALIGVLVTAFALAIPAGAYAGHDLGIYKVEKDVVLESDETTVDLSCRPGDYALDGMWRIEHADYDEDDNFITAIGRSVDVIEAYPFDSADVGTDYDSYHYLFNKNAIGRAQVKAHATCLKDKTEVDGHQHVINVDIKPTAVDAGDAYTTTPDCPINQFVAQTGYKITQSGADWVPFTGRLQEARPAANMRSYSWWMDLSQDPGSSVTYYHSCVHKKLPLAGGEKHKLVYRFQGPENNSLPADKRKVKRISCRSHYKAVVAGFSFGPPVPTMAEPNTDEFPGLFVPHLWYLGMEPQPKSRDFWFLNSSGVAHTVDLYAICLNYRTT